MSLFTELKRRNVFRVAIAYLASAWLLTEVAGTLFPMFGFSDTPARIVVIVLAIGFPLFLIFSWVFEITPEGLKREVDVVREESITRFTGQKIDRIIIVLLALALGYFAFDKFVLEPARVTNLVEETAQQVRSDALVESYGDKSVAVLPFVNMSADPEQEFFSDGISEELLNLLAKIPELRVISRSSAFSFKGKDIAIPKIAEQLNVEHILEGSVRKSGSRVRITAQLIDGRSDTHLWSETYDRDLDDIFTIQNEIAEKVVDALKITLLGDVPKARQVDPETYTLFLLAKHLYASGAEDKVLRATTMFEQVLDNAPDYVPAWVALGYARMDQTRRLLIPYHEGMALARKALNQALAIDPDNAEAHAIFGFLILEHTGDLKAASDHIQKALLLEPTNDRVLQSAASLCAALGRLDDSRSIDEYLAAKDPLNPAPHHNLAIDYLWLGQPEKAITAANTELMLTPDQFYVHLVLARALLLLGENEAALEAIQKEPTEHFRLFGLALVYHALGRNADSDAAMTEYIENYGQSRPYHLAGLLAYRAEADRAFEWLKKGASLDNSEAKYNLHDPMFANIHDDPRWLTFLESLGMAPTQLNTIEFIVTLPN